MYLLIISIRGKEFIKRADEVFIYGITAFACFILYKSGFVRVDNYHMSHFFNIVPLPAAALCLYEPPGTSRQRAIQCSVAVLVIAGVAANMIPGIMGPYEAIVRNQSMMATWHKFRDYARGVENYPRAAQEPVSGRTGDPELMKIIGGHSADIIPTEISKIYFNGLRYDPRPVVQSYSAYTGYLDSLNYQKYMSPGAPDFILFTLSGIDRRSAFFDEPRTKLAIFNHYSPAGEAGGEWLLRKKALSSLLPSKETQTIDSRLGEEIPINNQSGLQYAKIFVRYSLLGRIMRAVYQAPALKLTLTLADSERVSYRAIPPLLEDGILLDKYIDTRQDMQLLMQSGGQLGAPIKSIRLDGDPDNLGFVETIKVVSVFYTFPPKPGEERKADSLGIVSLNREFNQYKPVITDTSLYIPDNFYYALGDCKTYSPIIRIEGWAARTGSGHEQVRVQAVLRSGDSVYALPSDNSPHPADFSKKRFVARVSKSQLPPGDE